MTDEMLAKLRPPRTRNTDRPLWLSLGLVVVLSAAIILPMVYTVWYTFHWRDFVSSISASTAYSYRNGGLQGTVDGQPTDVTGPHMYRLYDLLTEHMSKLYRNAPDEPAPIVLRYANGATLEVWEILLEDPDLPDGFGNSGKPKYGVFWRFTSSEGEVWMYDTDLQRYRNVWILVAPSQNQP